MNMKKNRAKKGENAQIIPTVLALQYERRRPPATRARDAIRRSKIVHDKPTWGWAKHPGRSDVKHIDDGSKRAKHRCKSVIKQHFKNMGLIGATVTNAKVAKRDLEDRLRQRKNYVRDGEIRQNLSKDDLWHLKQIDKHIDKDNNVLRRANYILPKIREIQQDIREVKKAINEEKGEYSYEAEHRLPELEERLEKQLFYLQSAKKRYPKEHR